MTCRGHSSGRSLTHPFSSLSHPCGKQWQTLLRIFSQHLGRKNEFGSGMACQRKSESWPQRALRLNANNTFLPFSNFHRLYNDCCCCSPLLLIRIICHMCVDKRRYFWTPVVETSGSVDSYQSKWIEQGRMVPILMDGCQDMSYQAENLLDIFEKIFSSFFICQFDRSVGRHDKEMKLPKLFI